MREPHILLDVRYAEEYEKESILNAINVPLNELLFLIDELQEKSKGKLILIYGATGGRGVAACDILYRAGFNNIFNLSGGIKSWKAVYNI